MQFYESLFTMENNFLLVVAVVFGYFHSTYPSLYFVILVQFHNYDSNLQGLEEQWGLFAHLKNLHMKY